VIFMHEDAGTRGNVDMLDLLNRNGRLNAQMLHAMRETADAIGLPPIRVSAKTDQVIETVLKEHGVPPARALPSKPKGP